jgi:hypothetical protein
VTTAIVVTTLGIVGIGIVINQLFRLRAWLKNAPPIEPPAEETPKPPDETA